MSEQGLGERTGQCICGSVKFSIEIPTEHFHSCHCSTCRRWGGGPWMAVNCDGAPSFESSDTLAWYQASSWAERGFCSKCGSSLFYRLQAQPEALTVVAIEALDDPSGLEMTMHIYSDSKPDHYDFSGSARLVTAAEFQKMIGVG